MAKRLQLDFQSRKNNSSYRIHLKDHIFSGLLPGSPQIFLDAREIEALRQISESMRMALNSGQTINPEIIRQKGALLFQKTFQPELEKQLEEAYESGQQDPSIQLALRVPEELASIWWELFYSDSKRINGFLAANPSIQFSRFTGRLIRNYPVKAVKKLKVLIVSSQPENQRKIDADKEIEIIRVALASEKRIEIKGIVNPTVQEFRQYLSTYKPNVLHFIGHAEYRSGGASGLVFCDKDRNSVVLSGPDLARMVKTKLHSCKLIILNACETATVEQQYANSIIGELVQAGVPAVIGMQSKIPNFVALVFSQIFYASLLDGYGKPVDYALNQARAFLYENRLGGENSFLNSYWCAPVLYTRSQNGLLFRLQDEADTLGMQREIFNLVSSLLYVKSRQAQEVIVRGLKAAGSAAIPALAIALYGSSVKIREIAVLILAQTNNKLAHALLEERLAADESEEFSEEAREQLRTGFSGAQISSISPEMSLETLVAIKTLIRDVDSELSIFEKEVKAFQGECSKCFRHGRSALSGLKTLKKWGSIWSLRRKNRGKFENIVDKVESGLAGWREVGILTSTLAHLGLRYSVLNREQMRYQENLTNALSKLADLEREEPKASGWKRLYWQMRRTYFSSTIQTNNFRRWKLKKKLIRIGNSFNNTSGKITRALEKVDDVTIRTNDNTDITIVVNE